MGLPPRVTVSRVIVVVKLDGNDIKFRIVVPEWVGNACSPVIRITDASGVWDGNPHGVYGDAIADYIGQSIWNVSISVACCHSGEI
jgi:hypothetical protein